MQGIRNSASYLVEGQVPLEVLKGMEGGLGANRVDSGSDRVGSGQEL